VTGLLAIALSAGTVMLARATRRRWWNAGAMLAVLAAVMPPAALGVGFIMIFNRVEGVSTLYTDTPWVWILALLARYGAVAVLITWLALRRRGITTAEQARVDGADGLGVLAHVLVPLAAPSLAAAGVIVAALAMFEVVVTQLVGPVGWPSIAMTILGHMHYGRDDVVITTSLAMVAAGFVLTQLCGWLLVRRER
jgi:iron(III) transport system permease protein